ncbi:MAG: hypothetical protein R2940_06125 [Syntrophotaleaceae bacterium]
MRQILADDQTAAQTALYPVSKNSRDDARLARLVSRRSSPATNDILQLFNEGAQGTVSSLDIISRLRLLSNKMFLAATGATRVPLVLSPYLLSHSSGESLPQPIDSLWGNPAGLFDPNCPATASD